MTCASKFAESIVTIGIQIYSGKVGRSMESQFKCGIKFDKIQDLGILTEIRLRRCSRSVTSPAKKIRSIDGE